MVEQGGANAGKANLVILSLSMMARHIENLHSLIHAMEKSAADAGVAFIIGKRGELGDQLNDLYGQILAALPDRDREDMH